MSRFFCSAWEMSASGPSQSPDWLKQIQERVSKDYQTLDIITLLIFLGTLSISDQRPFTSPSNVFISASYSLYQSLRYPHFIFMFSCCASTLNQSRNSISVFSLLLHFLQKKTESQTKVKAIIFYVMFPESDSLYITYLDCNSLGSQTSNSRISAYLWLMLKYK